MGLSFAQVQAAISYNQAHAMDVLPAIERELGRSPSAPGRGWWDVATVECVANLQQSAGLSTDGLFGLRSRLVLSASLRGYATESLWPPPDRDQRKHWASVCAAMGYPLPRRRNSLLGLRGVKLDAAFTHPVASNPDYDDTFVWVGLDGSVRCFAGATHSYQAPDKHERDEEERTELATIRPGRYVVRKTYEYHGHPALYVFNLDGTNLIPVWLDSARRLSQQTVAELPTRISQLNPHGAYTRGIMFHPGFDTAHSEGRFSSLGSQTASLADIERLYAAKEFDYLLLDATEVVPRLHEHSP